MSQVRNCKQVDVNLSSSGDNTLIAATAATSDGIPALPIKIWGLNIEASGGANNLIYKNGSTAFNASAIVLVANGNDFWMNTDEPKFICSPGNAFVINLSAATEVTGRVYYTTG